MKSGIDAGELSSSLDPMDAAILFVGVIQLQFESSVATDSWDLNRLHRTIDLVFDGITNHD
jgi:hypothetical protein